MKVLCKKTYDLDGVIIFIKNNWYHILSKYDTYDKNSIVASVFVESKKKYGTRFYKSNYKNNYNYENLSFEEYFYSAQELRYKKLKKLKLNEQNN